MTEFAEKFQQLSHRLPRGYAQKVVDSLALAGVNVKINNVYLVKKGHYSNEEIENELMKLVENEMKKKESKLDKLIKLDAKLKENDL